MEDKTIPAADISEYKYSESETESSAIPTPNANIGEEPIAGEEIKAPESSGLSSLNWRRFLVPGGIILTILVVYFAFNFYSSAKARKLTEQKQMAQQQAAVAQPAPLPAAQVAPMVVDEGISSDKLEQIQNAVQQKTSEMTQQIESNKEAIANLNGEVSQARHDISAISQQLEQLTAVMQKIVAEKENLKAKKVVVKKKKTAKLAVPYHVRAIVPGRAWLESPDGKSVTVRVGDKLEGYGEVQLISPRQGVVIMSNGSVIQYGVNDF